MSEKGRIFATLIVWAATTIMMGILAGVVVALDMDMDYISGGMIALVALVLVIAAFRATEVIWTGQISDEVGTRTTRVAGGKAKRNHHHQPGRMERLLEALDDDDIYDLEALLLAREEEREQHRTQ
ncbi:MAG: hypothetical protein GYB65_24250 [Chloroflexi bacterium]|nr:hypothetical protein [Chloroflexota bacterium]